MVESRTGAKKIENESEMSWWCQKVREYLKLMGHIKGTGAT